MGPNGQAPLGQQYYQQVPLESRTGFGANANLGFQDGIQFGGGLQTPLGSPNANFDLRAPTFGNSNLMMGLIVFLGVLSLINIFATVITPWFTGLGADEEEEEKGITKKNVETGRRYQRNINLMADYVLNGIENFAQKNA
jgi:hypothetical protein